MKFTDREGHFKMNLVTLKTRVLIIREKTEIAGKSP